MSRPVFGPLPGALSVACAALVLAFSPATAEASPHSQNCKIQGEVLEITVDTSKPSPTVTFKLKITALEEKSFMSNPCAAVGSEETFEIDNDAQAIDDKIIKGDVIKIEKSESGGLTADGYINNRSQTYQGRVEAVPETTPPSKPPTTP